MKTKKLQRIEANILNELTRIKSLIEIAENTGKKKTDYYSILLDKERELKQISFMLNTLSERTLNEIFTVCSFANRIHGLHKLLEFHYNIL